MDYWALLLDLIPPILHAWKLIIFGMLVSGAFAYFGTSVAPKSYSSTAYVGPFDESVGKYMGSVIRSAPVLTAVLDKFPDYLGSEPSQDRRRDYLDSHIRFAVAKGSDPKRSSLYTLEIEDGDALKAQALGVAVIDAWLAAMKPQPESAARLNRLISASEAQTVDLTTVITELMKRPEALTPDIKAGYFPPNVADMIKLRTEGIFKIEDLRASLSGISRDVVLARPMMSDVSEAPPKTHVVLSAMGSALFVLIGLILIGHVFKKLSSSSIYGPKLKRIVSAFPRWRIRNKAS